jgi:hypothetical protein
MSHHTLTFTEDQLSHIESALEERYHLLQLRIRYAAEHAMSIDVELYQEHLQQVGETLRQIEERS